MPTYFHFVNYVIAYNHYRKNNPQLEYLFNKSDYELGKKEASSNLRSGVARFLIHNDSYISAIATFHCFPDYIAGHIAHILGKELTRIDTDMNSVRYDNILIAMYSVEGVARPFLISYINPMCDRTSVLQVIGNKMQQICKLRNMMLVNKWMTTAEEIHLYEGVCELPDCNKSYCGHPEFEYVPKYAQIRLEADLVVRKNCHIIVHRLRAVEEFSPGCTVTEKAAFLAQQRLEYATEEASNTSEPDQVEASIELVSQQESAGPSTWSMAGVLTGLGLFAVCAGMAGLAVAAVKQYRHGS